MKDYACPYCGRQAFATLCRDCQAEGIRIHTTKSIFHIGRCHRCGHLDDEPCAGRLGARKMLRHGLMGGGQALKEIRQMAYRLAARAAETFRGDSPTPR